MECQVGGLVPVRGIDIKNNVLILNFHEVMYFAKVLRMPKNQPSVIIIIARESVVKGNFFKFLIITERSE
jgi:hypothetical protein